MKYSKVISVLDSGIFQNVLQYYIDIHDTDRYNCLVSFSTVFKIKFMIFTRKVRAFVDVS